MSPIVSSEYMDHHVFVLFARVHVHVYVVVIYLSMPYTCVFVEFYVLLYIESYMRV